MEEKTIGMGGTYEETLRGWRHNICESDSKFVYGE